MIVVCTFSRLIIFLKSLIISWVCFKLIHLLLFSFQRYAIASNLKIVTPLLIHAFLFENSSYLNKWSKNLPNTKNENCYLNFIASHDGIGMRPTEGLLNEKTLNNFLKRLKKMAQNFLTEKFKIKLKRYMRQISQFLML